MKKQSINSTIKVVAKQTRKARRLKKAGVMYTK